MKKLTIGSAVYDDFEGVYFTYQSLRLNTQDIWDDLEFIIIDNNPTSPQGKAVEQFCGASHQIKYIPYTEKTSTAIRNEIFKNASGEFCMSIDPHVLFEPNTIHKLLDFFKGQPDSKDLYHGPMLYDQIKNHEPCSQMKPVWRDNMFGIWDYDKQGNDPNNDPFEICMHGLGVFACRTKAWLGFNENFRGFGGEEGYIHDKFRHHGGRVMCLPFLRWIHRFQRPLGVPYPATIEQRIKNYAIGHKELGWDDKEMREHFKSKHPNLDVDKIVDEA